MDNLYDFTCPPVVLLHPGSRIWIWHASSSSSKSLNSFSRESYKGTLIFLDVAFLVEKPPKQIILKLL